MRRSLAAAVAGTTLLLAPTLVACSAGPSASTSAPASTPPVDGVRAPEPGAGPVLTLAFAGDVHFADQLGPVAQSRRSTFGPLSRVLRRADVSMVNLETALTAPGDEPRQAAKELEDPDRRFWFRAPTSALGVLSRSGVDVATVANNHGADYGVAGLDDALRAGRASGADGGVTLIGAGPDVEQAYAPYRTTVRGQRIAVLAGDASPLESRAAVWRVAPGSGPGIAAARGSATRLVTATRQAAATSDLVVVYLHWGAENVGCPTVGQERLAARLTAAGADVIVGSHAHQLQGAGELTRASRTAYVSYGLGNFFWYHGLKPHTGVLRLRVQDGRVLDDVLVPAQIPLAGGAPQPLRGTAADDADDAWRELRSCTDLSPGPGESRDLAAGKLPPYAATVSGLGPQLRRRMSGVSYRPGCPVPLADLRHLSLGYVGFDGEAHRGDLVVAADVAHDVVDIFRRLYRARFPIARLQPVEVYGGGDDASMAANNSSGFNCRPVAGTSAFSRHAYGLAVDINPVQNPYLRGSVVAPPRGRRYVDADRSPGATAAPGVITRGDVVVRAFARIGWTWGGDFADPDYQHFARQG